MSELVKARPVEGDQIGADRGGQPAPTAMAATGPEDWCASGA
jgi:hypothetical protein